MLSCLLEEEKGKEKKKKKRKLEGEESPAHN
jgi:hypothetical protein